MQEVNNVLTDLLQKQGNWLFKHRSYLPLVLVVLVVAALSQGEPLDKWETIELIYNGFCIAIGIAGFIIRIKTVAHAPRGTSGRNTRGQVADQLNTTGMYSVMRHPLYLGNFLMWLSVVMFTQSWWFTLVFLVMYALYYERIMLAEEAYLSKKFGDEFVQWAASTPAFFPRFRYWIPSKFPFSLRTVLRREYSGMMGWVLSLVFVEVVGDLFQEKHFELDIAWAIALGVTFVLFITLRTLKKLHKLDVQGR